MKANILTILFISTSIFLKAQDSLSILFIGNSYTYVNDLPTTLSNLTLSLGDKITFDSQTIGGASFQVHANNSATYTKIHSKPWDFVVLQGQSQEPSFPYDQVNTETIPFVEQLADSVYRSNPCSQVMMYMTWGRQDGDPQWDSISTFDKMNSRLHDAYLRIMDSVHGSISPVASAWKYVRDNYPSINLYQSDGSHPSIEGTYLIACTFYSSIFRKSPIGASFTSGLPQQTVDVLQNAAMVTVLSADSLIEFNLHSISELVQANYTFSSSNLNYSFANSSLHASNYLWDFGDGTSSIEMNPSHTFSTSGNFSVKLIVESSCGNDTITEVICTSSTNGLSTNIENDVIIKNIDNDYYIYSPLFVGSNYILMNSLGQIVSKEFCSNNQIVINFKNIEKGIYFLKIENKEIQLKLLNQQF